jgi:hypothetical protein
MAKLFQITETKIDSTTHLTPKVKLLGADHVHEVVSFGSGSLIRISDNNNISKVTERVVTEDKSLVLDLMDVKQGSIKVLSLLVLNDEAGDAGSEVKLIPVNYILEVESDPLVPSNSIVTLINSNSTKGKKYVVQETLENILTSANAPSSAFKPTVNDSNWVEVSQESDFGTAVAGTITLSANTTYFIRGEVTINSNLVCNVEGVEIVGTDRNSDHLVWDGVGALLAITDVNFGIRGVKFSSNNINTSILDATNISAGDYNAGRLKVLTILNCQFRGTYDVIDIKGYDLVDINNCLFFYIKATNFGLRFEDTSKIQLSSCELIRWFDETTIPAPSGWATVSMIELMPNNISSFGAVNINGCVIHPQQEQNGIEISALSTTGFGTISSNAFVTVGLNPGLGVGRVFLPVNVIDLPDYSATQVLNYDIFANQGLLNSTSGTVMTVSSNTTNTVLSSGVPTPINTGGIAIQQAGVRYNVTSAGRSTYISSKQKFVSIHASISYQKQGGGTDDYIFYIYKNGVLLSGSAFEVISGVANSNGTASINYGVLMELNDYLEVYVENPGSNDDILIKNLQLIVRE